LDRYAIKAAESIFIDDNINNVTAAKELGFYAIHFENPIQLEKDLSNIVTF
jgi:FMN phosphatase YigB (HAD superfamily)